MPSSRRASIMTAALPSGMGQALTVAVVSLICIFPCGCQSYRAWRARSQATKPAYRAVKPAIAYEILRDNPQVLILDLRPPDEYLGTGGHLRNAVNLPLVRLPYRLLELSSYRGETFLVYCDTEACSEAGMAVLLSSGFSDAILISGGIQRWMADGFKTFLPASAVGRVRRPPVPELLREREQRPKELPVITPPPEPPPHG